MREASKTNSYRNADFFNSFFSGSVLDIGAGNDLVCQNAIGFDVQDGDANYPNLYFSESSFDTVHSSHCLEHMVDPVQALHNWWSLVKPFGFLVITVPDEDLYEQGIWPSAFNSDHKSTFRINKPLSWSPVSYDLRSLCENLSNSKIISINLQDFNYDRSLIYPHHIPPKTKYSKMTKFYFKILRLIPFFGHKLIKSHKIKLIKKGYPFDQSAYDACCQIQVVIQKISPETN